MIERRVTLVNGKQLQAGGFGAGNFRALFEAIEREQMKRGSLLTYSPPDRTCGDS